MNCDETRERLSGLIDDALEGPEQAEVGAHLEGCPECRRELDRLRATVSLLARVERPRAPVDFVERVMAAAHPVPWHRRLGRWLFLPLSIKLPVQASAVRAVAVLGVYLLQRTPELRDAARPELQRPASRPAPSGATTAEPTPPSAPGHQDLQAAKVDAGKPREPVRRATREAGSPVRAERRLDSPQPSPPLKAAELKGEPKKEANADRLQKASAPAPLVAPSSAPAPAAPPAESRAKSRDAAEGQSGVLGPEPPAMSAKPQGAASSVVGRLNVKSRAAAEQGLADLLARLGGSETGRRQEFGATVVDVLVPEARYADLARGLATLGAWTSEGAPVALPTDPPQIRLSIRISE